MLQIHDLTQDAALIERGRLANNFWTRLKGLMGVRRLAPGDGLLIAPAKQIHTHWMLISIDVLYVDETDRVVDWDERMKPWKFGRLRKKSQYVVELPAGTIAEKSVQVGDQLHVDYH